MIKKIFITGAAGFIGSHLSEKLYEILKMHDLYYMIKLLTRLTKII